VNKRLEQNSPIPKLRFEKGRSRDRLDHTCTLDRETGAIDPQTPPFHHYVASLLSCRMSEGTLEDMGALTRCLTSPSQPGTIERQSVHDEIRDQP